MSLCAQYGKCALSCAILPKHHLLYSLTKQFKFLCNSTRTAKSIRSIVIVGLMCERVPGSIQLQGAGTDQMKNGREPVFATERGCFVIWRRIRQTRVVS